MQNRISVETQKVCFPVAEDLYGLFFEDINRSGDGGLYPEMLRNRSFEDSLTPGGCHEEAEGVIFKNRGGWPGVFNHGEGMDEWAAAVPFTPVPAWYADKAIMKLEKEDTLNENRLAALDVTYEPGGKIWNIGYAGVPVKKGAEYRLYVFIKTANSFTLKASLESGKGETLGFASAAVKPYGASWQRLDFVLRAEGEDFKGRLALIADTACSVRFGFASLMPKETFKGHGLRADIVEMLQNSHPKFLRFPGGCIVEGFSEETAMRFSHTIGPVWKRPSHNLMWHYRTTNGLGFHEYLQLCEDTGMEPMYVCNCGMSCQARVGEFFDDEAVESFLQEALHALEYALGPVNSVYGAKRKEAGHPEPFRMKYVEIGNENWGPEYNKRYEKFYKVLKEKYPDIIYISNSHTEKDGLPTEIADEHYYNTPEFFLENENRFDSYDRGGPEIFVGEYAVNGGNTIASMECALAEAVFLIGAERNQDIVKLTAYAPLLQNADYTAWKPNLIVFDNHQVYGIPSYHAISMLAKNRGKEVITCNISGVEQKPPIYRGVPGILCEKSGLQIKNAKINGKPADISRIIYGGLEEADGTITLRQEARPHPYTGKSDAWNKAMEEFQHQRRHPMAPDENSMMWVTFGQEDLEEYVFEVDLKFDRDNPVTLSIWNYHPNTDAGCNEPKDVDWNFRSVRNQIWKIEDGKGSTEVRRFFEQDKPEQVELPIQYDSFNTYKIVTRHAGYECYINGQLLQKKELIHHPVISAVATAEEETILLKLAHVGDKETDVEIRLDCDVMPEAETEVLSAPLEAVNSMEQKLNVAPVYGKIYNAGRIFTYSAPAHSLTILKLKKA